MASIALKNPSIFFDQIRPVLFSKGMAQSQVNGINAILSENDKAPLDPRWLAYILATAYWETAQTMQPVRETKASTDDEAIRILDRAYANRELPWVKAPYWRKDADGKSWLGRGFPQLTHKANYQKLSKATGVDLVADPDRAMDLPVAIDIMFLGMIQGLFTGAKLGDFFNGTKNDWVNGRRIINGVESAEKVAGIAKTFYAALKNAA
ncbi:hypothetical protein ASC97_05565 [Rhizobium sp. Root1203]|uniref:hypothetical protein n=1 Tax=Rhizobium sp. Root1203 TaxID=1736427 RepID=UPI0007096E10|nr:hypothetical protein [Rhizobium sp. Root1203]KQV27834.1 hypothetical protein ASC97_05565 [Rhizobium sp. Root1203]